MIRQATTADVAAVARVHVESWEAAYRGLMPDAVIDSFTLDGRIEQWGRFLASPGARAALVAEHDGVIGMASFGPAGGDDVDPAVVGEVYAIYVLPDHWGHGHGRTLMDGAVTWLGDHGFADAVLWVLEANARAHAFYQAGGWRPDGATHLQVLPAGVLAELRYRLPISDRHGHG